MNNEYPKTPDEKLDRMIYLLEKIEGHLAPPPIWQRWLRFIFNNFTVILSLMFLVYVTWKIWGSIQSVSENVETIQAIIGKISGNVGESIRGLRFWDSPTP